MARSGGVIRRIGLAYEALSPGLRGMLLMVLGTMTAVGMHGVVKHLSPGMHAFEIAFFRNSLMLVFLAPMFWRYGFGVLRTRQLRWHATRAVLGTSSMLAFFMGLGMIPLAQATALGFTTPIFATLLAILFLGEVVRLRRWTAIGIGFLGTLVIVQPWHGHIHVGALIVIYSAAAWAGAVVIIRFMGRTDSALTTTLQMALWMSPLSLVPALFVWQWPTVEQLLWLLLAAGLGTVTQFTIAQALRLGDTSAIMPVDFLRMIWATAMGILLFGETPDAWTWIGAVMVFAATSYIAYRESRLRRGRRAAESKPEEGS
ncbi:MAG: DMT family transporter [Alphaproteobacteria bacterium]